MTNKLEKLQNFFIHQLLDVTVETKNVTFSQIPDLTENRVNNKNNFCESQINFLRKEGQNDNLIINDLLEQPFYTTTPKPLNTGNPEKSTKAVYEDSYKYPKKIQLNHVI